MGNYTRKEYKLEVKIAIQEWDVSYVDFQGAPLDPDDDVKREEDGTLYYLGVNGDHYPVRRNENWNNGGRLSIEENMQLGSMDFMGLMGVMGEMHNAVRRIQDQV